MSTEMRSARISASKRKLTVIYTGLLCPFLVQTEQGQNRCGAYFERCRLAVYVARDQSSVLSASDGIPRC